MSRPVWAVVACALVLNATPGTTISSDLGNSTDTSQSPTMDGPLGQSFSTGSSAYMLTLVTVVLSNEESGPVDRPRKALLKPMDGIALQQVTVTLWSNNNLAPGTLLATSSTTLYGTSMTPSPAPYGFAFSYQLAPNTRYWIEVTSPNSDSTATWWATNSPSGTDISTEYTFVGVPPAVPTQAPFAFLVGVFGVVTIPSSPAPSSWLLVSIGLTGAAWFMRRSGRKVLTQWGGSLV